jgi:hypothetical protein
MEMIMIWDVIGFLFFLPIVVLITILGWNQQSVGWGCVGLFAGFVYWYVYCIRENGGLQYRSDECGYTNYWQANIMWAYVYSAIAAFGALLGTIYVHSRV